MPFKKGETPKGAKPFQKGQSGNPKGKVEGVKNRATVAKVWLECVTEWTNPFSGKKEMLSLEDQITLAQIKAARDLESTTAYKNVMDSRYGAPKQDIGVSGGLKIGVDLSDEKYED